MTAPTHAHIPQLKIDERNLRIKAELKADSILDRIATGARHIDPDRPNMCEYFTKWKGEP